MFYIFCTALFLLPVFWGVGAWVSRFVHMPDSVAWEMILGLMTISIAWTLLSFFVPLDIYCELITLLIGVTGFFRFRKYHYILPFIRQHYPVFAPFFLLIAFAGSFYPFLLDFFGYYLPSIQWLHEIGMVKGISNLDLLLGQMSLWHILQAGFSGFSDPFLRLNTILLSIYLIYILEKKSFVHLLFFPVFLLYVQSPSPDLPVMIFALMTVEELFRKSTKIPFLFLFSVYIFAIKPTMIWLPVFVFLYAFFMQKMRIRSLIPGVLMGALFVLKNLWTFGYPIFPLVAFDVGIPWKPNPEIMAISHQIAVQKTFDMQYSYSEIQNFGSAEYFFRWLFLDGIKSFIHISFILSLLGFIIYSGIQKKKLIFLLLISVLIKSILVLIFSAQYRFFIDVFLVIAFTVLYPFQNRIKSSLIPFSFCGMLLITLMLMFPEVLKIAVPSFRPGSFMRGYTAKQLYRPSEYHWKNYTTHRIGNLKFNLVEGYPYSFDTPLPAISPEFVQEDLDAGIFPQMNSSQLKDGFHWTKIPEKEQIKLKEILRKRAQSFERK